MLEAYFDDLLARMQTPEAREGAKKAFNATPEELGEAAVQAAKKKAGQDCENAV
jgi:antitoxin Phd